MNRHCVIVTSYFEGDMSKLKLVSDIKEKRGSYFVIAADGGFDLSMEVGITPDLLVGDLDSNTGPIPEHVQTYLVKAEKDETDLDLAIEKAIQNGSGKVTILGGIGGRLDHTIGNIQTMVYYAQKGIDLSMMDECQKVYILIDGTLTIPKEEGCKFSVFSHTPLSEGVTIKGGYYPLDDYNLKSNIPLAISNEFVEKEATISVEDGILIIVVTNK